jgi:quercetin dioxygenase-like cupin family protein
LVCFEPGQEIRVQKGSWRYYVITGTLTFAAGEEKSQQASGHLVRMEPDQEHLLANRGEVRAMVLALRND